MALTEEPSTGVEASAHPTVIDALRREATERGDAVAIDWDGGARTYAELLERAEAVAGALRADGVSAGERVALVTRNGIEMLEVIYGAMLIGAVPTPINWRLAAPEVEAIVRDAQAALIVASDDFAETARAVAEGEQLRVVILDDYEQWLTDADTDAGPAADHTPAAGDVAIQFYSSGTTGKPKGVELTHANISAMLALWGPEADFDTNAVNLVALPLFHVGGLAVALAGLYVGGRDHLVLDLRPEVIVEAFVAEGVTHAFLVPAVLQALLGVDGVADRDFSALRVVVYGASPISDTVLLRLLDTFGCAFFQVYGLTETSSTVVMLRPEDHDPEGPRKHLLRACGKAVPGTEVRVVDHVTQQDVPTGEVGEVWIKGPSVMKGYWNNPGLTAEALTDGWFHSGDAGFFDAEGYLFLHDRIKDMIVSGGENIYPAEVENALASHPGVADVAVIGVPHERWGETPKAIVVRSGNAEIDEDSLLEHARANLARFKCPTSVDWVDELPRNPSGKVLKRELRAEYWEGHGRGIG